MKITPVTKELCRNLWQKWIDGEDIESEKELTSDESIIRKKCLSYFQRASKNADSKCIKRGSAMDADFCAELYYDVLPLSPSSHRFTLRHASDDAVWRRLTMFVIPDIVQLRWPIKRGDERDEDEHEDGRSHFWDKPQRNWLKSLWWYAHFANHGDKQQTKDFLGLISNHTDPIQHLVERAGRGGYRVEVNRDILGRLGSKDGFSVDELKRVMIINTAMLKLVEPQMHSREVRGYVDELLSKSRTR